MIGILSKSSFANLTIIRRGGCRAELQWVVFAFLDALPELLGFLNSCIKPHLLNWCCGFVVVLSWKKKYLLTQGHESGSEVILVIQEARHYRIRSFAWTQLKGLILRRGSEICQSRLVVAVFPQGHEREGMVAFNDCLVFWHWNYIYNQNSKYSFY